MFAGSQEFTLVSVFMTTILQWSDRCHSKRHCSVIIDHYRHFLQDGYCHQLRVRAVQAPHVRSGPQPFNRYDDNWCAATDHMIHTTFTSTDVEYDLGISN
jgi:hypothetical protein